MAVYCHLDYLTYMQSTSGPMYSIFMANRWEKMDTVAYFIFYILGLQNHYGW